MAKALEIWEKLRVSVGEHAQQFYQKKLGYVQLDKIILERGGTDFDKKHFPDDPEEKVFYKTDLYIWQYMDMHIKQNLEVLRRHLSDLSNNFDRILFIDLGCGPMTSGIALSEIIPNKNIIYLGIDIAENMVESARYINREYKIFNSDNFNVKQDDTLNHKIIDQLPELKNIDLAILNMSFILAPETNKALNQDIWAQNLAQTWNQFAVKTPNLKETRAIYLNPSFDGAHQYWDMFQKTLRQSSSSSRHFSYLGGEKHQIPIATLPNPVITSIMIGQRNE